MDSIRPLQNYDGNIVPQAVLNGTLGTVVYASNYNDLDNKPSINSVELRGNKTAEDLGLATPADITVTSVNNQTGDVSLTGQNIPYDSAYSVTEKINDLESQIVDSGVSSVNGQTGAVILTGSDINYSVGVSLNAKIDAVEGEIPVVNYPVTSVNSKTGAVVLAGSDIEYSAGVSINTQIENVARDLADLTAEDIPMSGTDSTPTATAIGDLSTLTTSVTSSLVGAVNEVNTGLGNTYTKTEVNTELDKKAPVDYFNRYDFSSSMPIVISNVGAYHCFLILGFVQGIGIITVIVKIVNGTLTAVDFISGASFSNANITFSYNSGAKKLTITTPQAGGSYLAIMRTGSM